MTTDKQALRDLTKKQVLEDLTKEIQGHTKNIILIRKEIKELGEVLDKEEIDEKLELVSETKKEVQLLMNQIQGILVRK